MNNIAIGGMSNDEIFLRATEAVSTDSYDLVVVMWSGLGRHWVYDSAQNVDDFTIINYGDIKGFNAASEYTTQYAKLHYSHFNNIYVNTKRWLLQCIALEKTLKCNSIPHVFIKGFDNNITALNNASYSNGFSNIGGLETMLDFDNRPDAYILKKLHTLQRLVDVQDQTHWLNLSGTSFFDMIIDVADDQQHPGPNTNQLLANNLINFTKGINEQSI